MATHPLPPHRRLAAWLVTGPVGHFAAGVVDWVVFLARVLRARARGKR
jgi:hypothetical protein